MQSYGALWRLMAFASRMVLPRCVGCALLLWIPAASLEAQISFSSAISLALRNSPRVKMAQDDVNRALAVVADAKDQFIPTFGATGGVGWSYGITLNVPTIVTLNTQSLIFNSAQREYIRSARDSLEAANLALADVRSQVEEDTANTYLSLDGAQLRHSALVEEHGFATKLVAIVQDRLNAGLESELDLKKARRQELQTQLDELSVEDEMGTLREQLADLIGLPPEGLTIDADSIPPESSFSLAEELRSPLPDNPNVQSSEANANAKLAQSLGDLRYAMRPQISFQAQYGRVSPVNDVSEYYNLHGKYNTFEAGVAIALPFFDRARSARARETVADALHAQHELENARSQQAENRLGSQHSVLELSVKAALAQVDLGIAQDELTAMLAEAASHNEDVAGRPMTAKDEQNARMEERARFVDLLNATEQLHKAQISLLRQTGALDAWLASLPKH